MRKVKISCNCFSNVVTYVKKSVNILYYAFASFILTYNYSIYQFQQIVNGCNCLTASMMCVMNPDVVSLTASHQGGA